jgi:FkbM family methyltransferase
VSQSPGSFGQNKHLEVPSTAPFIAPVLRFRRLVRGVLACAPPGLALPILSGPLRGRLWLVQSGNYSCWLGNYEKVKQQAFTAELRAGNVVFDIGAHVGFYSLLAAIHTRPGGQVFAFEPVTPNTAKLRRNVALNRVSVEVIEAAVADRDGQARFRHGPDSYTGSLDDLGDSVAVVTVDALVGTSRVPKPDVMKIDVEGAEGLVLQGASRTILAAHPIIFLAVHGGSVRGECLSLLATLGYQVKALVGDGIRPDTEFVARPDPNRAA